MPQTGLPPTDHGEPPSARARGDAPHRVPERARARDDAPHRMPARSWTRALQVLAERAGLLSLVAVPVTFMPFTVTVFEPAKVGLLRGLALAAALFWLGSVWGALIRPLPVGWPARGMPGRLTFGRRPPGGRNTAGQNTASQNTAGQATTSQNTAGQNNGPLAAWTTRILASGAAVLTLELLSTVLSPAPARSLFGSFERGQGWLTTLSVAIVAGLAWAAARRGGQPGETSLRTPLRWLGFIGVGALPAGLYAAVQARPFGLDPLPWAGDVAIRATGPAGNSVLLGAYLAAALPAAAVMTVWAWRRETPLPLAAWLMVSAVASYGLWVTASRGPLLALGVGATAAGAAWALARGRRVILPVVAGVAALGLLVALNAPGAGDLPLMGSPMVERLSQALDPDRSTGRVRMRLWQGSADAVVAASPGRLLIGYGPDGQDLVWARVYPPILAYDEPRGWVPDRAHTLLYDRILTTGLLGALAWLGLMSASVGGALALMGLGRRHIRLAGIGAAVGAGLGAAAPFVARAEVCVPEPFRPASSLAEGAACLAAPGAAVGAVGGLIAGLVLASWLGPSRRRDSDPAPSQVARLLGVAAVTILVGHWVETTVGFAVTSTQLVTWVTAGLVAGTCLRIDSTPAAADPALGPKPAPDAHEHAQSKSVQSESAQRESAESESAQRESAQRESAALESGGRNPDMGKPPHSPARCWADSFLAAAGVGLPLTFAFTRPGLVTGGEAVTGLLIVVSIVVSAASLWWGGTRPDGGRNDDPPVEVEGPRRLRWLSGVFRWTASGALAAGLVIVSFALVHWLILAGPWTTPLGGLDAAAATLIAFAASLALSLVTAAWFEGDTAWVGRPRGPGVIQWSGAVVVCSLCLAVGFVPSWAEAALQEAERGWLAEARELRAELETGRARLLMSHADERLVWATRLLPGQPEPVLARARLASELGTLLADRLARQPPPTEDLAAARDAAFAESRHLAMRAAGLAPGWPEPWLVRARGYRAQAAHTGRRADAAGAAAAYSDAIARAPRWPEPRVELARLELERGRPEAALALAEEALALDPFYRPADRLRGAALVGLGRYDAAVAAYAAYFDDFRNASDLDARREQLVALAAADRLAPAVEVATEVVRMAPDDAHARADLAALLLRLNRADAALAQAQVAASLDPDDAGIGELLERILARLNQADRP